MEKKRIESFEDLLVWQKGIALVKQIYLVTSRVDSIKTLGFAINSNVQQYPSLPTLPKVLNDLRGRNTCCFSILPKALPVKSAVCYTSR